MLLVSLALAVVGLPPVAFARESVAPSTIARIEALDEEEDLVRAIEALATSGEFAVPQLIEALRDAHPKVRCAAARTLGSMGNAARTAAEPLAQALVGATADEELAWACSRALSTLQASAKAAVPVLARTVSKKEVSVELRCVVAITLGSLGAHAKDAVPEMMSCFDDTPTTIVHPVVAIELGRIGKPAAAQLDTGLAKQKPIVQFWRIAALACAGEEALGASNALVPLVSTDQWMIHPAVRHALERMGGRAKAAREKARSDEDNREKGMRKGGLFDNWTIDKPAYLLPFFYKLGIDEKTPIWLPDRLEADKENYNAGDMIEAVSHHFMEKLEACRKKLEDAPVRSHAELATLFYGVPGLGEALRLISEAKNMNLKLWPK